MQPEATMRIRAPWGDYITPQQASASLFEMYEERSRLVSEVGKHKQQAERAKRAERDVQRLSKALETEREMVRAMRADRDAFARKADQTEQRMDSLAKRAADLAARHEILRAERADSAQLVNEFPDLTEQLAARFHAHRAHLLAERRKGVPYVPFDPPLAWAHQFGVDGTRTDEPVAWREQSNEYRKFWRGIMAQVLLQLGETHTVIERPYLSGKHTSPSATAQLARKTLEAADTLVQNARDMIEYLGGETINMGSPKNAKSLHRLVAHYLPDQAELLQRIKPIEDVPPPPSTLNMAKFKPDLGGKINMGMASTEVFGSGEPPAEEPPGPLTATITMQMDDWDIQAMRQAMDSGQPYPFTGRATRMDLQMPFRPSRIPWAQGGHSIGTTEDTEPMRTADDDLIEGHWHREEWENEGGASLPDEQPDAPTPAEADAMQAEAEHQKALESPWDDEDRQMVHDVVAALRQSPNQSGPSLGIASKLLGNYVMEALVRAIHSEDLVLAFIHLGVLHQIEREGPHAADGMPVRTITLGTTLDALEANPEQFLDQLAEQMKEHENCKTVTLDVTQLLGAVFGGRS